MLSTVRTTGSRIEWDQGWSRGLRPPARDPAPGLSLRSLRGGDERAAAAGFRSRYPSISGRFPPSLLVGAYGLKIQWSDGHSTGIYTFELSVPPLPLLPVHERPVTAWNTSRPPRMRQSVPRHHLWVESRFWSQPMPHQVHSNIRQGTVEITGSTQGRFAEVLHPTSRRVLWSALHREFNPRRLRAAPGTHGARPAAGERRDPRLPRRDRGDPRGPVLEGGRSRARPDRPSRGDDRPDRREDDDQRPQLGREGVARRLRGRERTRSGRHAFQRSAQPRDASTARCKFTRS